MNLNYTHLHLHSCIKLKLCQFFEFFLTFWVSELWPRDTNDKYIPRDGWYHTGHLLYIYSNLRLKYGKTCLVMIHDKITKTSEVRSTTRGMNLIINCSPIEKFVNLNFCNLITCTFFHDHKIMPPYTDFLHFQSTI